MQALREGTLVRPNGERVSWSEYGQSDGKPVLFCHGWPSSRTMAELTNEAAREQRVRIISPDRPGIADSTYVSGRRLLDWPALAGELADHLELAQFNVLGISGGAPYAYATAWGLPERIRAIAVVSGAPHIAELPDHTGLLALYRLMLAANKRWPRFSRWGFRLAKPWLSLRPPRRARPWLLKMLQPCDASCLQDEQAFQACFESQRRAWTASADGVLGDAQIYAEPWGFSLGELQVPVRLWHGTADRSFSADVARQTAAAIPRCQLRLIKGAGHYSTPIRHMREILADLISV